MKKLIVFMTLCCLVTILNLKCFATTPLEQLYNQFEINELIDKLPNQTTEVAEKILEEDISIKNIISITPIQLFSAIKSKAKEAFDLYKKELLTVITAVLILTMLNIINTDEKQNDAFELICTLTILSVMLKPMLNCISSGCEIINNISKFMLAYVPVYTSVLAASGSFSAAAAYQTIVFSASQIINQLSTAFFIPMLQGYMLLTLAGSISKNNGIIAMCTMIKKAVTWGLVLVTTIYTGILSFQNILGSSSDSAFSKTAKFIFGSFVPVIGSVFSDALTVINGSMKVIRAIVGGVGLSAVVLGFLPAIVDVAILRGVLWISSMIGETVANNSVKSVLAGMTDVMTVLMALLVCTIMLLVISTAIMMTTAASFTM